MLHIESLWFAYVSKRNGISVRENLPKSSSYSSRQKTFGNFSESGVSMSFSVVPTMYDLEHGFDSWIFVAGGI